MGLNAMTRFIMATGGIDCSPPLIPFSDPDKMVCIAESRLLEHGGVLEVL